MVVLLFIAKSVWHFPVPWWMWLIAAFDRIASAKAELKCRR
jgi:hypothetical protein